MVGKRIILPLLVLFLLALFSCPNQGSTIYDQIVIDTFHPDGGGWTDTQLTLIDSGGNTLATNDDGNPAQGTHIEYSRIDQADLSAGTYYIKVSSSTGLGDGYYGLRVLTYDPGSTFPTPGSQLEAGDTDDAVDGNGVPTNPVSIALEQVISRRLDPLATDDDWFKLVLP